MSAAALSSCCKSWNITKSLLKQDLNLRLGGQQPENCANSSPGDSASPDSAAGAGAGRQQGPHYCLDSAAASLNSACELSAELDSMLANKQEPAVEAPTLQQPLAVETCASMQQGEKAQQKPGELLLLHLRFAKHHLLT